MKPYIKTAQEGAIKAGKILLKYMGRDLRIRYKGEVNLVTEADRRAEETIVRFIRRRYPQHQILAEEGNAIASSSPFKWIIDPLDGTTNYAHGFPSFCVSIGLEIEGRMQVGVVYDPVRNHLFGAQYGKGAFRNGKRLRVSDIPALSKALLVTGFAYDARKSKENNFDHFTNFTKKCQGVRRTGSAALDLCYLASGWFDGFWELKLNPWDTAAGSLIAAEAGGTLTDFGGTPFSIYMKEIVASNGKIHNEMIRVLNRRRRTGSDGPEG